MSEHIDEPCPMCGAATRVFYNHWNTWAVCVQCRIGAVIGRGYAPPPGAFQNADEQEHWSAVAFHRQAPPGATYTHRVFWIDLGHAIGGRAMGWPDRGSIERIITRKKEKIRP